jgi:hypothetical protein
VESSIPTTLKGAANLLLVDDQFKPLSSKTVCLQEVSSEGAPDPSKINRYYSPESRDLSFPLPNEQT